MMPEAFSKDFYIAVATLARPEAALNQDAADAVLRFALEEGASLEVIGEIESMMARPIQMPEIERKKIAKNDRVYAYAVGRWIAELSKNDSSQAKLDVFGEKLGVPERQRAVAEEVVREVAALPTGSRPDSFDLAELKTRISARFAVAAKK